MTKTIDITITAPSDVRVNAKEAGLGDGMRIVSPGTKLTVSEATARELVSYGQAKVR